MTIQPMTVLANAKNIRFVEIPEFASSSRKGTTFYDKQFERLLEFKDAVQIPESEFESVRKAATRFLSFRKLEKTISVRQKKDYKTKTYLLWFLNQPPVSKKRKSND